MTQDTESSGGTQTRTIRHNGTTIHTRWPSHAFIHTTNLVLAGGGDWRVDPEKVCRHCDNNGVVALDHGSFGAPCPMCALGGFQNRRWFTNRSMRVDKRSGEPERWDERQPFDWYWRPGDDLAQYSWNGGLSVDHVGLCVRCSWPVLATTAVCSVCRGSEAMQGRAA